MSQNTKTYQMCQTDFPILQFPVTTDVRFEAHLHVSIALHHETNLES